MSYFLPLSKLGPKEVKLMTMEEVLRRPVDSTNVTRRTFNSVKKDLDSGKVWLQCDPKSVRPPYLACAAGWQDLSQKLLSRLFTELPLKRTDYIKGKILPNGEIYYTVTKWTWTLE